MNAWEVRPGSGRIVAQIVAGDEVVAIVPRTAEDMDGIVALANASVMANSKAMLVMLNRVQEEVASLEWTGQGCCPFCEMSPLGEPAPPCELATLIAKAEGRQ